MKHCKYKLKNALRLMRTEQNRTFICLDFHIRVKQLET